VLTTLSCPGAQPRSWSVGVMAGDVQQDMTYAPGPDGVISGHRRFVDPSGVVVDFDYTLTPTG
jgi:hypothetical protein